MCSQKSNGIASTGVAANENCPDIWLSCHLSVVTRHWVDNKSCTCEPDRTCVEDQWMHTHCPGLGCHSNSRRSRLCPEQRMSPKGSKWRPRKSRQSTSLEDTVGEGSIGAGTIATVFLFCAIEPRCIYLLLISLSPSLVPSTRPNPPWWSLKKTEQTGGCSRLKRRGANAMSLTSRTRRYSGNENRVLWQLNYLTGTELPSAHNLG